MAKLIYDYHFIVFEYPSKNEHANKLNKISSELDKLEPTQKDNPFILQLLNGIYIKKEQFDKIITNRDKLICTEGNTVTCTTLNLLLLAHAIMDSEQTSEPKLPEDIIKKFCF